MKTLKGAKHSGLADFRDDADAYTQAAFRWVLSNPDVSCAVISFFELQHVDEYLYASGASARRRRCRDPRRVRPPDRRHATAGRTAARASTRCPEEPADPRRAALPHVLRGLRLGEGGDAPLRAAREERLRLRLVRAPCLGACPVGVPIQERMIGAHELLPSTRRSRARRAPEVHARTCACSCSRSPPRLRRRGRRAAQGRPRRGRCPRGQLQPDGRPP